MSDPEAGLPAWIELTWPEPVVLAEIRLVFDTGLHRPLTLTHSDAYAERMQWGRPQQETVADYHVAALVNGRWSEVAVEKGNYQRLRVHVVVPTVRTTALRVTVTRTHGLDHARIVEIRAYGECHTEGAPETGAEDSGM